MLNLLILTPGTNWFLMSELSIKFTHDNIHQFLSLVWFCGYRLELSCLNWHIFCLFPKNTVTIITDLIVIVWITLKIHSERFNQQCCLKWFIKLRLKETLISIIYIGIAADNQLYQSMSDLLAQPGTSGQNADFHSSNERSGISYTNHDVSYDLDVNITTMTYSKYWNYSSFKYYIQPYCSWFQVYM